MMSEHEIMNAQAWEHVSRKNSDGTPMRIRRNGATKRWKRDPERFQIPVKHGLYSYGYITRETMNEWVVVR